MFKFYGLIRLFNWLDSESERVFSIGLETILVERAGSAAGISEAILCGIERENHFVAAHLVELMVVFCIPYVFVGIMECTEGYGPGSCDAYTLAVVSVSDR